MGSCLHVPDLQQTNSMMHMLGASGYTLLIIEPSLDLENDMFQGFCTALFSGLTFVWQHEAVPSESRRAANWLWGAASEGRQDAKACMTSVFLMLARSMNGQESTRNCSSSVKPTV